MENFSVSVNLSAVVSEDAADELAYLVSEFVQGVLNILANDEYDQVAAEIANAPQSGAIVPFEPTGWRPIFSPDEGSDAPAESDGATDFDRR